jgi:hypothetical protein
VDFPQAPLDGNGTTVAVPRETRENMRCATDGTSKRPPDALNFSKITQAGDDRFGCRGSEPEFSVRQPSQ